LGIYLRNTKKHGAIGFIAAMAVLAGALIWIYMAEPAFKTPVSTAPVLACRQDLQCWADKAQTWAETYCEAPVEHLSKTASRWTSDFTHPRFSQYTWANKENGTLNFVGDRLEIQNQSGAFEAYRYNCEFDPANNKVLNVSVAPVSLTK
jgi:hypothetical protein